MGLPREAIEQRAPRSWTGRSTSAARRQPGIKITPRAFGRDRRMPITNLYRDSRSPIIGPVNLSWLGRLPSHDV